MRIFLGFLFVFVFSLSLGGWPSDERNESSKQTCCSSSHVHLHVFDCVTPCYFRLFFFGWYRESSYFLSVFWSIFGKVHHFFCLFSPFPTHLGIFSPLKLTKDFVALHFQILCIFLFSLSTVHLSSLMSLLTSFFLIRFLSSSWTS